ncbi:acylphosphatase [Cyanobium sp. HWJ4-Hawea]|uniref:acylphosphatase n=1 Tax=unclassified Cyanobium TaxID=2627006 RepID=UPI0020CDF446|nr:MULTISPECIES: acylphosphatase [unclassified Cyanobium]MCP9774212.1 acylphosphatase [Cyanobium sp. WAJ14-Wanaka]MCP9809376.1 acylphosphatase [Cyanobium sp. HWJ4-Hawea]
MPGDSVEAGRRLKALRDAANERRFLAPHQSKPIVVKERWRLLVQGQVQGVGYRACCLTRSKDLGLSGWVKNLADGSVEVEAEGLVQDLTELRIWCETGPAAAVVSGVSVSQISPSGSDWFEVRS